MSRAAREAQAQAASQAVAQGAPAPRMARAPVLSTSFASGARPLPLALRADMEQRFGQDFASVRIATDRGADLAARGFGARAFTQGEQMNFAAGAMDTPLVAHELTHVLQQRQAGQAEIACAGTGLDKTVMSLRSEILAAPDADTRKPLVQQALALADPLAAALAKAINPQSADEEMAAEARSLLQLLGSALASKQEGQAAIELAGKTPDPEVQSRIVNDLALNSDASIAGQETFMSQLAPLAGQKVAAPGKAEQGRAWLAGNAPAIGKTLSTLDQRGLKGNKRESLALEKTEELMGGFMVTSDVDEKPDPTGNPASAKLRSDVTTHQIKADCDVYATVAARLLREQGWQTVGYMVLVPDEKDPKDDSKVRAGHAVSLSRKLADAADPSKGYLYLGTSNTSLVELGGHGTPLANEDAAMQPLVDLLFDVYQKPKPAAYDIYYERADAKGAYKMALLDPKNLGLKAWRSASAKATAKAGP